MSARYYPFLRGKQFDLLALKELSLNGLLSPSVIPVIEPAKSSKTLFQTVALMEKQGQPFYLIDNPRAGDFLTETGLEELGRLAKGHRSHILNEPLSLESPTTALSSEPPVLWIADSAAPLKESDPESIRQSCFLAAPEFRILRLLKHSQKVVVSQDPFTRLPRNSYYREAADELFYGDLCEQNDWEISDFLMDSRIYYEQSYPDRDLCLHLSYQEEKNQLRVRHFVSPQDPEAAVRSQKEKFLLLMTEVQEFFSQRPATAGLQLLFNAHTEGRFPGMGVLRKAAVMHHLQTMSRIVEDNQ